MNIEKFESMLKQIKVLSNKLEDRKLHGNNNYNLFVALLDIKTRYGYTHVLSIRFFRYELV